MIRYILNLLALCFLFSCTETGAQNGQFGIVANEELFSMSRSMQFPLDSISDSRTRSVSVYPKENPKYFVMHGMTGNKIDRYDLQTGELIDRVVFDQEGENGMPRAQAMHYHNEDSIFLFHILSQRLFLVNSKAELLETYDLLQDDFFMILGTTYPAFVENGDIIMNAYPHPLRLTSDKDFGAIRYDLSLRKISSKIPISKRYEEGYWGKHNYARGHQHYNDTNGKWIISYPIDHDLMVQDIDGNLTRHEARSEYIKKMKPPFRKYIEDDEATFDREAKTGFYAAIFHDRWRDLYYRVAYLPSRNYENDLRLGDTFSLIVLNNRFEKLGEQVFDGWKYTIGNSFLAKEGFFLFNYESYKSNEDFLTYDVFVPSIIE